LGNSGSDGASGFISMSAVREAALERYRDYVVEHFGDASGYVGHLKLAHARRVDQPAASFHTEAKAVHFAHGRRVTPLAVTLAYSLRRDGVGAFHRVDES
jgi:hypothetical protein